MNKLATYLVKSHAILFVIFLCTCFFYNRFAIDDYYFIGEVKNNSFIETYKHLQFKWHGRWTSNFALVGLIQLYDMPYFLQLFNFLSFVLLYISVFQLLKSVNKCYGFGFNCINISIYSSVFISIFFFCTQSPNETWFWYTGSVVYLWSIIAFLAAIKIFYIAKPSIFSFLVYSIGLIYIGGANEPLVIFLIFPLVFLIVKNIKRKTALVGLLLMTVSFLINYLSSGTINRDNITPSLDFLDTLLYSIYGTVDFLFFEFHYTFFIAILFSLPFYYLGKKAVLINENLNVLKHTLYSCLLIGIVVFINQLIVVIPLGSLPPDRSLISASLFICFILIRYFFILGNSSKLNNTLVYFSIPSIAILFFLIGYSFKTHYKYAEAVDERIKLIVNSEKDIIEVEPLPNSGFLHLSEITSDTSNYKNLHLKSGLGVNSTIILKQ